MVNLPWLVWLSGLCTSLQTERLLLQLLVGAHAWVAGQAPGWRRVRGNQSMYLTHGCFSPSLSLSLPVSLKQINKTFFRNSEFFC